MNLFNMLKSNFNFYLLLLLLIGCNSAYKVDEVLSRKSQTFNENWLFQIESENEWQKINIPHSTKIEPLVVNNQWQGTAWYIKEFDFKKNNNQKVFLKFDGIMHEADVWLNEKHLTKHVGGYLPFGVDLTNHLADGNNKLKVKVNNEDNPAIPPGKPLKNLDFNYYGGIYRDVNLLITNKIYVTDAILANKPASGGILVHFSEITKSTANGFVKVHIMNESKEEGHLSTRIVLKDKIGKETVQESEIVNVRAGGSSEISLNLKIDNPQRWSPQEPNLYELSVELLNNNKIVDKIAHKVGIRKIELRAEGFFLNDEKIYIPGTNRHQEYPYVGYAISDQAAYRDAVKIKQAGFDFVRLSHYPQDDAFLDACDELGIIVMDAIPGWQFFGDDNFVANSYKDIREMVRKDRNHPSVAFWEVSLNESGMTDDYMHKVNEVLKEELPFSDTYSAGWIDHEAFDLYIPARQHATAPEYWTQYDKGDRKIFIAEYGDWEYYAYNAGFNQKAFNGLKQLERTSRQLREKGEQRLLQQALNFQEAANSNRQGKNTIGDANWLMFDYNRGYSNDLEASGISDIFRLPKFAFYFYQSQRPPTKKITFRKTSIGGPMVKIASYWDKNSPLDVRVFSNCEEVALYLNDSLLESRKPIRNQYSSHLEYPPYTFSMEKFTKGTLKAEGLINGKIVVEDIVVTPGKPERLKLALDDCGVEIAKAGSDILILHARVLDNNKTVIPSDSSLVYFSIEKGNAQLLGENPTRAKAGIASILLKTENLDESIIIKSVSDFLGGDELMIPSLIIEK